MTQPQEHKAGDFCWVELTTPDTEGAVKFYANLFPWNLTEGSNPEGGTYTCFLIEETPNGGIFQITEEMKAMNVPPHWASYVLVDNTDEIAKKAESLGGKVLKAPFDIADAGRMAVLMDPTGATFCVWQTNKHKALRADRNQPGAVGWIELMTDNVDVAGKFYCSLFGWGTDVSDKTGVQYTCFKNGENYVAGMMAIPKECKADRSAWSVYFSSTDVDATVERAGDWGGKVFLEPRDIPDVGRFAVLQDPQGAFFCVMKFDKPI